MSRPVAPLRDRRAIAAVDLGAESCRVSLLRWRENAPLVAEVHRFANGPVRSPSGLRWPLETIVQGVHDGLLGCAERAPEGIRSIAVDGWAVDYVRLGESNIAGEPPFCYRDERTLAAERAVHAHTPAAALRELTGVQMQRINTAYQLVADRMAGLAPARWLNLPEYLLFRLGGCPVAELTNATHTQLVQGGCCRWSAPAFRLLGLDITLAAPLVPPGTPLGLLRGDLAAHPAFQGTELIAPACHDTASAVAGIPAREDDGCWAYISSGTWSLVGTLLHGPENGAAARAGNYTNLAAAGGRTLFHKGLNGMWLLQQCLLHWSAEGAPAPGLAALIEQAAQAEPPAFLLDVDDPALLLQGNMPERIRAQLARAGERPLPQTSAAAPIYANLIFRSLAARYAAVLAEIATVTGKRFRRIYVVGGGSRNGFLNRLVEEATGLPVVRGPAESSTNGNLAVQLAVLEDGQATAQAVARWAGLLSAF